MSKEIIILLICSATIIFIIFYIKRNLNEDDVDRTLNLTVLLPIMIFMISMTIIKIAYNHGYKEAIKDYKTYKEFKRFKMKVKAKNDTTFIEKE